MKVLHINTSAHRGGAARAMLRLHSGLKAAGHSSQVLTRSRSIQKAGLFTMEEVAGFGRPGLERVTRALATRLDRSLGLSNLHISTRRLLRSELFQQADVIHLHNLHGWYFDYRLLPKLSAAKPVVWTLHDMWAVTGHCAYSYDCTRWMTGCYSCPLLKPSYRGPVEPRPTVIDRTRSIWERKQDTYKHSDLNVATPSRWLLDIVQISILATAQCVTSIPNGIDLNHFHPLDQASARAHLDIPAHDQVILFVSEKLTNKRKGFALLLQALERIRNRESVLLLTFGVADSMAGLERFRCRALGSVSDEERQNLAYNAADVFVFPTLADNQPLVILESLACGTPIVSFDVGGVPEMVRHMETGYLATYRDVEHLAMGVDTLLDRAQLRLGMRRRCRQVAVAEYGLDLQLDRYVSLYDRAIHAHPHSGSPVRSRASTSHGE